MCVCIATLIYLYFCSCRGLTSPHRCCKTSLSQMNRIFQRAGQDMFFILCFLLRLKLLQSGNVYDIFTISK